MKENKDTQIKVRITTSQKERLDKYCEASGLNLSQFLRMAINEILNGGRQNDK
jgi:predicted DNA binding CopG/RHH family protein